MQFTKHEVKENLHATVSEDASGHTQLEQYTLQGEIGKGAFGKVHFAQDRGGEEYAIKEFSKSKLRKKEKANLFKLGPRGRGRGRARVEEPQSAASESSSPLDLIRVEIAILKKLNHPNIVRLYEVLDVAGSDSMYMVFEWCEKGVLMPVSLTETYENRFSDAECRDVFQQIVLGIEYLHEHDIIHRDIKPDNLLRSKDGTVKIVDFGVSEMFDKKVGDKTKKSAGSPAFMAPELCRPDHGDVSGRSTDVWSIGITLFCLRYGRLPFVSESLLEIQKKIRDDDLVIPEAEQDERFINLIKKLLEKDPEQRVNIDGLRDDPWLTDDGKIPLITKEENTEHAVTEITENDIKNAFSKVGMVMTVVSFFLYP
ncbi:kinase-like domain-containing protein [Mortierella sp. GBAus27b]|nr:kinase-like domain-containing protein [Mortierella sp. GBAus27b]